MTVDVLYAEGRRAWPQVALDEAAFTRHLERLGYIAGELHAADLYLACACTLGAPQAVEAFDQAFMPKVAAFVASVDGSPSFVEEVRQHLRDKLLVAPEGGVPKIADYSGRGPLGGWVRVSAVRAAIDLQRRRRSALHVEGGFAETAAVAIDPEMALIKARYEAEFSTAIRSAMASLSARERNVLYMHFVDGQSIDRIGAVYKTHRATAARWLARTREKLLDHVHQELGERLRLTPSEFVSLTAAIRSQLDVSLSGLLRR